MKKAKTTARKTSGLGSIVEMVADRLIQGGASNKPAARVKSAKAAAKPAARVKSAKAASTSSGAATARVTVNAEKLKALRTQVIYTKQVIDPQRINVMYSSYKKSTGQPNVIRRARFFADLMDEKTLYIDDNLFVGSLASQPNAIYTYPEFGTSWMLDKTVVDHLSPEDLATNAEVKKYWDDRSLSKRTYEVFEKKFGFDYKPVNDAGLTMEFISWPGGGGNLNYPKVYNEGLASMIKECEERQAALDMRLPNAAKLYFLESVIITLKAIIRLSHRYAALAKDMAGKEKDAVRKQELLAMAEVCERVPEHPARNYREALHCHFFIHICCELEQVGCGYSEAYLGRDLEPFYQKDKAAGLISQEEATYLLKLMFCKLNEISYYYGQDVSTLNSNDTGQTISIGGWSPDGFDGTPEMDYLICDAVIANAMPVPPLSLMYHDKLSGKFLDKCLEVTAAGWGMPQFINADNMVVRSLIAYPGITLQEARGSCGFACVATAPPHQTGHPVEGEINIAKSFELALNDGVDPRTKQQVGPKTGDPEKFKGFEELYEAFRLQNDFGMVTIRRMGFVGMMINSEVLPVPLRSALTGGCIESGTDVWSGGARWYCPTLITTAGIDAVNSLMAVKQLVFDDKKLTMAQLRKALAADFVGYENIQKMCVAAPKHGNDIDEVNKLVRRVYDDTNDSFQKVGGNFLSADIKANIDHYSKSIHSYFGMLTGALPTGRQAGVALCDGSVSAYPGTDVNGPTALAMSAAKGIDIAKVSSAHLNMKLAPNTFKSFKGKQAVLALIKTYMDMDGNHIQFNIVDTETLKDAKAHPEKYPELVVRVAGFSAFFTRLAPTVQDEIIRRTIEEVTHDV